MAENQDDVKKLTATDVRIGIIKKYGVVGLIVVLMPFATPYIEKYIANMQLKAVKATVEHERKILFVDIATMLNSENRLSDETLMTVTRLAVAKQSIHKVAYIKSLLKKYDPKKDMHKDRIKLKIKNELIKQSAEYINFLNTLNPHHKIGKVGVYIADNFPMDKFLESVYVIVFSGYEVELIADDIMNYMLAIQDEFFIEMENKMKKRV